MLRNAPLLATFTSQFRGAVGTSSSRAFAAFAGGGSPATPSSSAIAEVHDHLKQANDHLKQALDALHGVNPADRFMPAGTAVHDAPPDAPGKLPQPRRESRYISARDSEMVAPGDVRVESGTAASVEHDATTSQRPGDLVSG